MSSNHQRRIRRKFRELFRKIIDNDEEGFVKELDDADYDVLAGRCVDSWSLLHHAASRGRTTMVKALLLAGSPDFNKDQYSPLFLTVRHKHQSTMHVLLADGNGHHYVNSVFGNGQTLVHVAVEANNWDCLRTLREYGCWNFDVTYEGRTPLEMAAYSEMFTMVFSLLCVGARAIRSSYKRIAYKDKALATAFDCLANEAKNS